MYTYLHILVSICLCMCDFMFMIYMMWFLGSLGNIEKDPIFFSGFGAVVFFPFCDVVLGS